MYAIHTRSRMNAIDVRGRDPTLPRGGAPPVVEALFNVSRYVEGYNYPPIKRPLFMCFMMIQRSSMNVSVWVGAKGLTSLGGSPIRNRAKS